MGELRSGYQPQGRHKVRVVEGDTITWLHWNKSSLLESKGFVSNNVKKFNEMKAAGNVAEGVLGGRKCYIDIKGLEAWYETI